MKKTIVISLSILTLAVLIAGSFALGFRAGQTDQWKVQTMTDLTTSQGTVGLLRVLRDGHSDVAIKLLETSLDYDILLYREVRRRGTPFVDPLNTAMSSESAMDIVADYRKKYPPVLENDAKRKRILKELSRHGTRETGPAQQIIAADASGAAEF